MKRSITLILVILLLAVVGWFAYQKVFSKTKSLTQVEASEQVTAAALIAAFEKDSAAANKQYLGKVLLVSGQVKSIDEGGASLALGDPASMSSVRCSMDSAFVQQVASLKEGSNISVKGNCTGFISEELLGSDVILNRCVLEQNK